MKSLTVTLLILSGALVGAENPPVNRDAATLADFEKRVEEYAKLNKAIEAKLHKMKRTSSQEKITYHRRELAHRIREARRTARQGDIFTPEISAEFHRLIGIAMQGQQASHIKESLRSAEPVRLRGRLRVNEVYPDGVPLQSTPPTLLLNLPQLPPEVDYRVVDHHLVLRDVKTDLIVDFIPSAIP